MKIAFYTPQLDLRGTCVAIHDYALYNEVILKNQSFIVLPESSRQINEPSIYYKFSKNFRISFFKDISELEDKDYDILYMIKYGKNDGLYSSKIWTIVHCVFDMSEPHGNVYAAVSENLSKKFKKDESYVPHMISLKKKRGSMREMLGISNTSLVFGRHGGQDTFDIGFVKEAIKKIAMDSTKDIYFLFVNTPIFFRSKKIIHIPSICDLDTKSTFINTCDAMIHAQTLGETFGLSIGEFSVHNKPVITYGGEVWNDAYRDILGSKAMYYNNEAELYRILTLFCREEVRDKDWNCYREYSPKKVMERFQKIFIKPYLERNIIL
jgi:hypothetical protein